MVFHTLSDDVLFVRADLRFRLFLLLVRHRSSGCGARNLGEVLCELLRNVRERGLITLVLERRKHAERREAQHLARLVLLFLLVGFWGVNSTV